MRVKSLIPAPELRALLRENGFVGFRAFERGLVCRGPELSTVHVTQITERAPVIAGGIFAPPRYSHVFPTTVTASSVRNHHAGSAIRRKLHVAYTRLRAVVI